MTTMRLILDTNLLFKGGAYLDRGQWPVLISAARMGLVSLCIPEVVVSEHVSHYRQNVAKAARERAGSLRKLDSLRPPEISGRHPISTRSFDRPGDTYVDEWTESYERWLRGFIDEHGQVLPLPGVSHDILLRALLGERRPFGKDERGYKDALIWWTVIEALGSGVECVFATDNKSDFLTADGAALAEDLVADLRSQSIDPLLLGLRPDVDTVVAELVPRDTPVEEQFLAFARSTAGSERIAAAVDGVRIPLRDSAGLMPTWPKWIESSCELEDPEFIHADARPVHTGGYLVSVVVAASSHVVGGLEEDQSIDPGPGWIIWDDWGDGLTYAHERMQRVTYKLTVAYTPPAEVTDVRIESASLNAPWLTHDTE